MPAELSSFDLSSAPRDLYKIEFQHVCRAFDQATESVDTDERPSSLNVSLKLCLVLDRIPYCRHADRRCLQRTCTGAHTCCICTTHSEASHTTPRRQAVWYDSMPEQSPAIELDQASSDYCPPAGAPDDARASKNFNGQAIPCIDTATGKLLGHAPVLTAQQVDSPTYFCFCLQKPGSGSQSLML